jgi:hypothetical protein
MDPTTLHIPQLLSLSFWGGSWGILLGFAIQGFQGSWLYWVLALAIGAIAPSLVALFIVFPLKGLPVAGGGQPAILIGALLLNGAWGIGVACFMKLFQRKS